VTSFPLSSSRNPSLPSSTPSLFFQAGNASLSRRKISSPDQNRPCLAVDFLSLPQGPWGFFLGGGFPFSRSFHSFFFGTETQDLLPPFETVYPSRSFLPRRLPSWDLAATPALFFATLYRLSRNLLLGELLRRRPFFLQIRGPPSPLRSFPSPARGRLFLAHLSP